MADAKIGTLSIDKAYIGSDEVQKMYLGETEVWSASSPSSGYSVSLNLTAYAIGYGQETYYATYVKVYDGTDNTGTLLASDVSSSTPTSANKSQVQETVTCQTGNLFVEWCVDWADYGVGYDVLDVGSSNCSITYATEIGPTQYETTITIAGDNAVVQMVVNGGLD